MRPKQICWKKMSNIQETRIIKELSENYENNNEICNKVALLTLLCSPS